MGIREFVPLLIVVGLSAQERPAFEVATIKPNRQGPESGFSENIAANGRLTARNVTVWNLIRLAYGLRDRQISGGPPWIQSQGFDIQANPAQAGAPIPKEQTIRMIQTLLEDRYQLKSHRETRQLPAYALTVDTRGPKLPPPREGSGRTMLGDLDAPSLTLASLCEILEFDLDRSVVNQTGLTGPYAIRLQWASERSLKVVAADPSSPSLFEAVREMLGLRLQTTQVAEEIFVIDSVEQPSEN